MSCIGCVPTAENEQKTPSKGVLGDEQVNISYYLFIYCRLSSSSVSISLSLNSLQQVLNLFKLLSLLKDGMLSLSVLWYLSRLIANEH